MPAVLCGLTLLAGQARGQFLQPSAVTNQEPVPYYELPERGNEQETENEDEIETDRDSFTPATTTAGYGRTIVESAYSFIDNRSRAETHSVPELIVRYGWNDWLELRIGTNYEVGGEPNSISSGGGGEEFDPASELERETSISYGLKVGLTSQDGWIPRSAAIVQASTPVSGTDSDTQLALLMRLAGCWRTAGKSTRRCATRLPAIAMTVLAFGPRPSS